MKKIKILMLHLGYGGVEKQTITMANGLANRYDIEIVSFYKLEECPAYEIDQRIKIKYLYEGSSNREEFKTAVKKLNIFKAFKEGIKACKILYLKKALIKKEILLGDADIFFSTRSEYGTLLSKYGNKDKFKLTQEHNFIDTEEYRKRIVKDFANLDCVVVISKYHERMYSDWFRDTGVKIARIENILDNSPREISSLNNEALVAVGRFDPIKDFSSAIEVMRHLVEKRPSLKLYLLGDGEERELLENKVKEYHLEQNVIMPGFVSADEVAMYMAKSDVFVMTSIKECFPMVILEAYDSGLPVVAFDVLTGPRELVVDERTGYLIENRSPEQMAEKILFILNDKEKLKGMSTNSLLEAKKYKINVIIEKWYDLFK